MSVLYTEPQDKSQYVPLEAADRSILWIDWESWLEPYEIYSEESIEALGPELREFVLKWRENARLAKETFVPVCPEKNAGTRFAYKDTFYEIPGMPDISNELYAKLSMDMEMELRQMGCKYVSYTGTVD
ncbi:MAG: hypothetical protein NC092_13450 [Butyrivibrio sp.]|nr:hypothetical protein [Muribaculum sp.]MCM1553677.1 hypothetical protein [Butyrivibrio sp.]